jgi:hypothetical protein
LLDLWKNRRNLLLSRSLNLWRRSKRNLLLSRSWKSGRVRWNHSGGAGIAAAGVIALLASISKGILSLQLRIFKNT